MIKSTFKSQLQASTVQNPSWPLGFLLVASQWLFTCADNLSGRVVYAKVLAARRVEFKSVHAHCASLTSPHAPKQTSLPLTGDRGMSILLFRLEFSSFKLQRRKHIVFFASQINKL